MNRELATEAVFFFLHQPFNMDVYGDFRSSALRGCLKNCSFWHCGWPHLYAGLAHTHTDRHANPHTNRGLTPTLLREGLLKDALVKAAERSAEVLKVRETELLVPRLGDG